MFLKPMFTYVHQYISSAPTPPPKKKAKMSRDFCEEAEVCKIIHFCGPLNKSGYKPAKHRCTVPLKYLFSSH